jgi:gamma-glutamylcyclotransferase (GGCT)/AIG2-like uncharacterized protein YtfP
MEWPRRLFFYGTLAREHDHPLARPFAGLARRGWVRGTLRIKADPGGVYPVLMPGAGRVWGWVLGRCQPISLRVISALDQWEEFDTWRPQCGEYRRASVVVHTRGGPLRAQAYVPNACPHPGLAYVPGGDFAAHVAARALRIYAE